jgi:hypothetical protein
MRLQPQQNQAVTRARLAGTQTNERRENDKIKENVRISGETGH